MPSITMRGMATGTQFFYIGQLRGKCHPVKTSLPTGRPWRQNPITTQSKWLTSCPNICDWPWCNAHPVVASTGTFEMASCLYANLMQLIWGLELIWVSRRFHLGVTNLQMSCTDSSKWQSVYFAAVVMEFSTTCLITDLPMRWLTPWADPSLWPWYWRAMRCTETIPIVAIFLTSAVHCKSPWY